MSNTQKTAFIAAQTQMMIAEREIMTTLYRTRSTPVRVTQWLKHGDDPRVESDGYCYRPQNSFYLCPGDYIIDYPDGRVEHCPQGEFAGRFERVGPEDAPPLDQGKDVTAVWKPALDAIVAEASRPSPTATGGGKDE